MIFKIHRYANRRHILLSYVQTYKFCKRFDIFSNVYKYDSLDLVRSMNIMNKGKAPKFLSESYYLSVIYVALYLYLYYNTKGNFVYYISIICNDVNPNSTEYLDELKAMCELLY